MPARRKEGAMELKDYDIEFAGLKQGTHSFDFQLNNDFFKLFGLEEYHAADIRVTAVLEKRSTLMDLTITGEGSVNVDCDVTTEPYDQPIQAHMDIVVKFGESQNNDDEDILVLPHGEHKLNIARYVYEMLVLSVPYKRVHPGVEDGTLQSEVLDRLRDLSIENRDKNKSEEIDPRWSALKKLKSDN